MGQCPRQLDPSCAIHPVHHPQSSRESPRRHPLRHIQAPGHGALERTVASPKFWRQNNYFQTKAAMHQTNHITSNFTMRCVRFVSFPFVRFLEERLYGRLVVQPRPLPCPAPQPSSAAAASRQPPTAANSNEQRGGTASRRLVGYSAPFVGASTSRLLPLPRLPLSWPFVLCSRPLATPLRQWTSPVNPRRASQRIGG